MPSEDAPTQRTRAAQAPEASAGAPSELVGQAMRHFAALRRLARQDFPQGRTALEPFLATVETLLGQLLRPASEQADTLAAQLEASQEALTHLDALMEAFSMRPSARR